MAGTLGWDERPGGVVDEGPLREPSFDCSVKEGKLAVMTCECVRRVPGVRTLLKVKPHEVVHEAAVVALAAKDEKLASNHSRSVSVPSLGGVTLAFDPSPLLGACEQNIYQRSATGPVRTLRHSAAQLLWRLTQIEKVQAIILHILRMTLGISSPHNQHVSHSHARMPHPRPRHLSPRLHEPDAERPAPTPARALGRGRIDARQNIEVVLDGVLDQSAEDVQVAGRGRRDGVDRVAVPGERRRAERARQGGWD